MPEAQIILCHAATYVACAPKSNSVVNAIYAAADCVKETVTAVEPAYLRDFHYNENNDLERMTGYKYAHDYPDHYVDQQYLPDGLENEKFYIPGVLGYEKEIGERLNRLRGTAHKDKGETE